MQPEGAINILIADPSGTIREGVINILIADPSGTIRDLIKLLSSTVKSCSAEQLSNIKEEFTRRFGSSQSVALALLKRPMIIFAY